MSIKKQFIITICVFCAMLAVTGVSLIITNNRVEKARKLERIVNNIAQGASELGYLSQDYLVFGESQQLERWKARFASFSSQVDGMNNSTGTPGSCPQY